MDSSHPPLLSVVIVLVGDTIEPRCDTSHVERTLEALERQLDAPAMEVIVPHHDGAEGMDRLAQRFPDATFVPVGDVPIRARSREHHDVMRARGCLVARGEIVAFLEDHVCPAPRWARHMIEAHREECAAVGGAVENGIDRPLQWAAYFSDLGKYQNPLPGGESANASTVNVSYKRAALASIRPIGTREFNEAVVNRALASHHHKLRLSANAVVYQYRHGLRFATAVQEFFIWGRSYAATRTTLLSRPRRVAYALLAPALPLLLVLRMTRRVLARGRHLRAYCVALPLTVAFTMSWSAGEWVGYLGARPHALPFGGADAGERQPSVGTAS